MPTSSYWWLVTERTQDTGIWMLLLETMAHPSPIVNVRGGGGEEQRLGAGLRTGKWGLRLEFGARE